jgi:hypothetical protein
MNWSSVGWAERVMEGRSRGGTQFKGTGHGVIQFWIRPARRRSDLSLGLGCRGTRWHNSSGTLFTACHGHRYVVKWSLAWRNRGQRRPLQRRLLGHVVGQMNMADEPVPETPFTSTLIFYPSIVYPPRAQHGSYW